MEKAYSQFTYNGTDYRFWMWKGDYLNLGAGAEMGIYSRMSVYGYQTDHWLVDTNLAMHMTLTLIYDGKEIIRWDPKLDKNFPSDTTWWVTGFNPYYQGIDVNKLTAIYTVNFKGNEDMYDAFVNSIDFKDDKRWSISPDDKYTLIFTF